MSGTPGNGTAGRLSLRIQDLSWVAWRVTCEAVYQTFNVVPLKAHVSLGRLLGTLGRKMPTWKSEAEEIESALSGVFDPSEVEEIVRRYVEFSRRRYLSKVLPRLRRFNDSKLWPVRGLEHLEEAHRRGRGVLLVSGHLGHARLIAPMLRTHDWNVVQVVAGRKVDLERSYRFEKWIEGGGDLRRRIFRPIHELVFCPSKVSAMLDVRPILESLSRNELVMILGDGRRGVDAAEIPYAGREYRIPKGFMRIAMATGAAVLPVFVVEEDGWPRMELHPELVVDPDAPVEQNLRRYVEVLEAQFRRAPHLWFRWERLASSRRVE